MGRIFFLLDFKVSVFYYERDGKGLGRGLGFSYGLVFVDFCFRGWGVVSYLVFIGLLK